jgi:capsular polysaccharide transport system permease protein
VEKRTPWQIQRAVVFAMILREVKTRLGGHWAGFLWVLGIPMVKLAIFVAMNVFIRNRGARDGFDFSVFLFVAIFPFDLFRDLWNRLTVAISSNISLFGYRQVKPMDALIARAVLEIAISVILLTLTALMLARLGFKPLLPADPLAYIVVYGVAILLGIGFGLTTAMFANFIPRFTVFTSLMTMPLTLLSGVIFQLNRVPEEILYYFRFNPLLHIVELSRKTWLGTYVPISGMTLTYPLTWALCMIALGTMLYTVRRRQLLAT